MNALVKPRGLVAVRAGTVEQALCKEVRDAIEGFKAHYNGEIDDLNKKFAAFRIGGPSDANPKDVKAAFLDLGNFLKGMPRAELSTTPDTEGGYTTVRELDSKISQYLENINPLRKLARVQETISDTFDIPFNSGRAASGWVGEKDSRPETGSPSFSNISVPLYEIYAMPRSTQRLLDDSKFNMEDFLNTEILKEFSRQEATAFISGNGVNKPRGFLTYAIATTADDTRALGTLQYVPTSDAAGFAATNPADTLITMVYKLKASHRANAKWLMNSTTAATVRKFKDAQGQYIWQEGIAASQPPALLGYPVEFDENMPDVAANALPVAFGDFLEGYIIVDRVGIRILRDPYTTKGYVNFYATKRVGGSLVNSQAIKVLKIATT